MRVEGQVTASVITTATDIQMQEIEMHQAVTSAEQLLVDIQMLGEVHGFGVLDKAEADFRQAGYPIEAIIPDGPEAAARVFDPAEYDFFLSDSNHAQRTGFAVRRGIEVVADDDFTALTLDWSVSTSGDLAPLSHEATCGRMK